MLLIHQQAFKILRNLEATGLAACPGSKIKQRGSGQAEATLLVIRTNLSAPRHPRKPMLPRKTEMVSKKKFGPRLNE
jgi:hypothetical protein